MLRQSALQLATALVTMTGVVLGAQAAGSEPITVYAAGSLRAPLTQAAAAFEQQHPGQRVTLVFGASGLLRDRLAGGERADVFASANMAHPQSLAGEGSGKGFGATQPFARNALCALTRPNLALTPATLVAALLDPAIKLGTSTPKADPSGDYAFALFDKVEQTGAGPAGSAKQLADKALQLTGGPSSPPPPKDRSVYGALIVDGRADLFLTYCTNAQAAKAENPALQVVAVPEAINVGAQYGVALRRDAPPMADAFKQSLMQGDGQQALQKAGFLPP